MKQLFSAFLTVFIVSINMVRINAQTPQKFNYQGIARDTKGNPMGKQTLGIKLSVLPTADATTPEYEEVQTITTNEFGLYTLQIGNGTAVSGTMKDVKWETGNKYIRVDIDPQGGTNYADAGTTQLLSVPYAIYADRAGMAKMPTGNRAGTQHFLSKFDANGSSSDEINSQLFDNGTNIGIGTTTPLAKLHINQNVAAVQEHVRMQNLSATGAGRFTMYSNAANNYATFTKYGSNFGGGYAGVSTLYPFANLLAFGNNGVNANDGLGRFLISTAGNAGISLFKSSTSKLKFHADFTTENVGIGGNSAPVSRVHMNNTDGTTMDVRLSNNNTGHTSNDGLVIRNTDSVADIINLENASLTLGTNNTPRMTITAAGNVEIANQVKIAGGAPGAGKVLTSDANGLATWETPTSGSSGVSSINGSTGAVVQSLSLGNSGTSPNIVGSGSNAVTINLPDASTFNKGVLSVLDFTSFSNKLNGQLVSLNTIPKGQSSTSLSNSQLTDNGTTVGINSASPNASALLHLTSSSKGVLFPQVSIDSLKDVTSVPNPANGLIVYNTTQPGIQNDMTRGFYWYSTNALSWIKLADNLVDNKWQDGGVLGVKLRDTSDGVEMMDNYLGSNVNHSPKVKILRMRDSSGLNAKNNINALVLSGINRKPTAGWESRQKTSLIFEMGYQTTPTVTSGTNRVAISGYTESTAATSSNLTNGLAFYTTATPENAAVLDTPAMALFKHNVGIGAYPTDINTVTEGRLQITGKSNGDQLSLRHPSSINLKWGIYVSSLDSSLNFYSNGSLRANIDRVTGVYSALSDRRFKKDIIPLTPVLSKVKKLKAYNYRYLDSEETDRKINGFMAQDLLTDFPELVYQRYDRTIDKPLYTVDYSGFGVIAIKAIQEQQDQIDHQKDEIELLKKQNQELMKRLEALETNR
jgi:hypothetical protein